jgi:hypothetical protein
MSKNMPEKTSYQEDLTFSLKSAAGSLSSRTSISRSQGWKEFLVSNTSSNDLVHDVSQNIEQRSVYELCKVIEESSNSLMLLSFEPLQSLGPCSQGSQYIIASGYIVKTLCECEERAVISLRCLLMREARLCLLSLQGQTYFENNFGPTPTKSR